MNLSKINIHLTVPYPKILDFDDRSDFMDDYYFALEDILACSESIKLPLFDLGEFCPKIIWIHDEQGLKQLEEIFPLACLKECEHLFISIEVPFEDEADTADFLPNIFMKRIFDLFIIANLCHPG